MATNYWRHRSSSRKLLLTDLRLLTVLLKILSLLKKKATAQLKEAKAQAAEIVEAAKKRETQIVEEAAEKAQAEKAKIIAAGHAEIETERNQAKEELRQQVAVLAVAGAEKILERSIDAAAHSDILDKLVAEL